MVIAASLVLVFSVSANSPALGKPLSVQRPCLKYEPEVVELVGIVKRTVFAGPPNYESVARGDAAEWYWVLHLKNSICVASELADRVNTGETRVRNLQLIFSDVSDYAKHRSLLGRRVIVTGNLRHAETGHHHTRVMLVVKRIKSVKTSQLVVGPERVGPSTATASSSVYCRRPSQQPGAVVHELLGDPQADPLLAASDNGDLTFE